MNLPSRCRLPEWGFAALVLLAASAIWTCADTNGEGRVCEPGSFKCNGDTSLRCTSDGSGFQVHANCVLDNLICAEPYGCKVCAPNQPTCFGEKLLRCNDSGSGFLPNPELVCDVNKGEVCDKQACVNACELARKNRSYVGCEYWAVDLDNAVVQIGSAAAQQFAVALSNASPLPAEVSVTVDTTKPGEMPELCTKDAQCTAQDHVCVALADPEQGRCVKLVKRVKVLPQALELLLLPALEVDGSPAGEFDTGTGTALTKSTYRISSTVPLIAYQFNPLANVSVFSNDASLLVPTSALSTDAAASQGAPYLVMGWPQTIATTEDPATNFGSDLRAFLTMVATRDDTSVRVELSTATIGDGPGGKMPARKKGDVIELKLDAYEVLNLETGGFGPDADFTGTRVETDKPLAVFSGSEASDVPDPPDLTVRRCCADHLEQQLYPLTTLGRTFIALQTPSRSEALKGAGATIQPKQEQEYFRILAASEFTAVTTNLPKPHDQLSIGGAQFASLEVEQDFTIEATEPIVVGQFVAGQQQAGIPSTLPGGDPSFILLPPVEQFRQDYLFLTPDKYSFDFILIAAPEGTFLKLDGREVKEGCDNASGSRLCCSRSRVGKVRIAGANSPTTFEAYKCQLSFPRVIEGQTPPDNLEPGSQNDGVHRLTATQPVGLVVYGFDAFVSYGYPGGTDLELINLR